MQKGAQRMERSGERQSYNRMLRSLPFLYLTRWLMLWIQEFLPRLNRTNSGLTDQVTADSVTE